MWHLLYAGTAGGIKDVPDTVAAHPLDFVTLTAPSFGPVHTTRGPGRPCHPRRGRQATFCPHGRPEHCPRVHRDDDPDLGTPLCPDCYDYAGQVAFNWYAPELWRRFTITLRRRLADRLGIPRTQLREHVTVSLREGGRVPTPRRRPLPRPRPPRRPRRRLPAARRRRSPSSSWRDAIQAAPPRPTWSPTPTSRAGRPGNCGSARQLDIRPVHGQAPARRLCRADAPGDGRRLHRQVRHQSRRRLRPRPARIHPLTDLAALPVSDHVRRLLATAVQIGSAAAAAPAPAWSS